MQGSLAVVDDDSMSRGTGLGAAVAALVALRETPPPGAWGPEALPWRPALEEYQRIGTALGGFHAGIQSLSTTTPA